MEEKSKVFSAHLIGPPEIVSKRIQDAVASQKSGLPEFGGP